MGTKQRPHKRTSKKGKKFPAGRGKVKPKYRTPQKRTMRKHKFDSYGQLKKKYPINPMADDDKDGVRNYKDCKPFNKSKQDDIDWNDHNKLVEYADMLMDSGDLTAEEVNYFHEKPWKWEPEIKRELALAKERENPDFQYCRECAGEGCAGCEEKGFWLR